MLLPWLNVKLERALRFDQRVDEVHGVLQVDVVVVRAVNQKNLPLQLVGGLER